MRPIRLALETQFALSRPSGLGVYAASLAEALRARPDVELCEVCQAGLDVWRFDRRVLWDQVLAPRLVRNIRPDVTHFTGGTLPLAMPHPCVLTVHDLAWLRGAVPSRWYARAYFGGLQSRLARMADGIAADTSAARQEILERLGVAPEITAVAGVGVDERWFALRRTPAHPPFVLAVGTVEARKDLETAVRAIALIPGVRLISAGALTPYASTVEAAARECDVRRRVSLLGYVEDVVLRSLFERTSALVFPSAYEGFGLPPLQGLAAGVPVVASDIPVLREVLGDAAQFVPPGSALGFAEALERALAPAAGIRDQLERGHMRARSFTWPRVADRVVEMYRSVLESPRGARR